MSLERIRAEMVRMRGFIRAAETQASKVVTLVDALAPDEQPTPPVEEPTPEEPTEPGPEEPESEEPTEPSEEFPHRPSGLTTIFDEKFEADWNGGLPGWGGYGIWRPDRISIVEDPTAPAFIGPRALRTALPAGTNGGVLTMQRGFGASYDVLYLSWWAKWDEGYDHNGTSEKLWNLGRLSNGSLIQFHWNAESFFGPRPAPSDRVVEGALHANLMPRRSDGVFDAPPPPGGVWTHYEFLFEKTAGRVRWWTNGEPRADHQGVDLSGISLSSLVYNDTWGGGGSKGDSGGRYTGRIYVAGRGA